jgi:hypothetical protein
LLSSASIVFDDGIAFIMPLEADVFMYVVFQPKVEGWISLIFLMPVAVSRALIGALALDAWADLALHRGWTDAVDSDEEVAMAVGVVLVSGGGIGDDVPTLALEGDVVVELPGVMAVRVGQLNSEREDTGTTGVEGPEFEIGKLENVDVGKVSDPRGLPGTICDIVCEHVVLVLIALVGMPGMASVSVVIVPFALRFTEAMEVGNGS